MRGAFESSPRSMRPRYVKSMAWRVEQEHLVVSPDDVEIEPDSVEAFLEAAKLQLGGLVAERETPNFQAAPSEMLQGQLPRFPREIETARAREDRLILLASPGHHSRLDQLVERYHPTRAGVQIVDGELSRGFRLPSAGCILFSDHQLFEPAATGRWSDEAVQLPRQWTQRSEGR